MEEPIEQPKAVQEMKKVVHEMKMEVLERVEPLVQDLDLVLKEMIYLLTLKRVEVILSCTLCP